MALIDNITTGNTFQQHVAITSDIVDKLNHFTDGTTIGAGQFTATSDVKIEGDLDVTGNINLTYSNFDNLSMNGNLILASANSLSSGYGHNTAVFFSSANTSGAVATRYAIANNGSSSYTFDTHTGDNPTLDVVPGQTYAFDLQKLRDNHPFYITTTANVFYNVGLTHVQVNSSDSNQLTVSVGSAAQGKMNGILYWKVPANTIGETYNYRCASHSGAMIGDIRVENTVNAAFAKANSIVSEATSLAIALS